MAQTYMVSVPEDKERTSTFYSRAASIPVNNSINM